MLEHAVLNTYQGPVTFDILDVDPNEILVVKSISGLDAPKITLFTGDYAGNGGYYQGRRFDQRNPVFTFKINPQYSYGDPLVGDLSVSQVRRMLYNWFLNPTPGMNQLRVTLETDQLPDLYFDGSVESIDTDLWEREQTAMVSMLALDPFLKSVAADTWSGSVNSINVPYVGDVATGIEATFTMGPNTYLNFRMSGTDRPTQLMTLHHPTSEFNPGDQVYINTIEGQRAIKLNGVDKMSMLDTDVWPELEQGNNFLEVWGDSPSFTLNSKLNAYSFRCSWWGI